MLASLLTSTASERPHARLAQHVPSAQFTKFGYGREELDSADLHQIKGCSSMTDIRQKVKAFILIKVDRPEQSLSRIEQTLEPLGIPVSIVDTGRQLHWATAVVVGVPEQRLADAMLALELKGFSDVTAFQGEANTNATQRGVEQQ
jgi:hypothetical protein